MLLLWKFSIWYMKDSTKLLFLLISVTTMLDNSAYLEKNDMKE